ncbi:MAG: hypothetical protein Athens101410_152 [Parcubacteria group bacterium Athens1014_10]|nr:MAG: hypothetical protein Athens101410_152 [Parcubacteria group bacterium Athens1014_10]TSD05879.1 MAG: hypothetical protein Athens071412_161 [Parcubacteria group bacterium Athens0714_12]
MNGFLTRKIVTIETLGEKLRKVREGKNLNLEEIAKKINIQNKYLEALENGNYNVIPGEIYVKNFIGAYAKFLGLNHDLLIELYKKERFPLQKNKDFSFSGKKIVVSQIFKKILQITAILFILFYLALGIKKNIFSPSLTIISPIDNLITENNSVKIIGQTEEEAIIKINDNPVNSSFKGKFEETLELKPGLNIIKISAVKKHSQEKIIIRKIMFIQQGDMEQ